VAQRHTDRTNVYYDCMRCGASLPLSEMQWQNGLLVCTTYNCYDTGLTPIVGSRDIAVARQVAIWRHELEPDPKLTSPVSRQNDQIDVLY
jgi:hypothetical protein